MIAAGFRGGPGPTCAPGRAQGYTLVELVTVIILLGFAVTGIVLMQSKLFSATRSNEDIQVGTFLMQGCAEHLLAVRQAQGYGAATLATSANATSACSAITASGYAVHAAPSVTITAIVNDTNTGCPAGMGCKLVTVQQGSLSPVSLLLVAY